MNEDERRMDEVLRAHRADAFADEALEPHIADDRLAGEPLPRWTADETAHLASCAECRVVLASRIRSGGARVIALDPWRRRLISLIAIAAGIGAAIAFVPRGPRPKGDMPVLAPEVTMTATDRHGVRRDVRSGDTLRLSDRVGFKYGNPRGEHRTVTVLGWDGSKVHWYFPDSPGMGAQAIEHGDRIGVRLPFEIELAGDHHPGPLTIVAQFDSDPASLAKLLEERSPIPRGEGSSVFELHIEEVSP